MTPKKTKRIGRRSDREIEEQVLRAFCNAVEEYIAPLRDAKAADEYERGYDHGIDAVLGTITLKMIERGITPKK